jgi:hypothetical protein
MDLRAFKSRIAAIGAAIGTCSCAAMIAATFFGLAGVIGLPIALALPDPVNSFLQVTAQPLLILSLIMIVFSATYSPSRIPRVLSLIGTPPTYAGMFLLPGSTSEMGGHTIHAVNPIPLLVFWSGVAFLVAAMVLARGRRKAPVHAVRRLSLRTTTFGRLMARRAVLATVSVGVLILLPTLTLSALPALLSAQPSRTQSPVLVKVDPDNFLWKGTVADYTRQESYFPSFSGPRATVTVSHRMTSGTLTMGIMDGIGAWVLRGVTISSLDPRAIDLATESGRAGKWMIILTFDGASGYVEVNIKSD